MESLLRPWRWRVSPGRLVVTNTLHITHLHRSVCGDFYGLLIALSGALHPAVDGGNYGVAWIIRMDFPHGFPPAAHLAARWREMVYCFYYDTYAVLARCISASSATSVKGVSTSENVLVCSRGRGRVLAFTWHGLHSSRANLASIYEEGKGVEGGKSLCPRNLSDREGLDNYGPAIRAVGG